MGHLGAEELRRVQRGLVDHHGHALGLHALHDALDGARTEIVGVGLHRQAVHAHDRLRLTLVDAVPDHLQHLVGHEVLAGAVGVHDGLDQVLRHVPVVGQQLLGVLGQAVAAVAEAGVVVVRSDARLQADAVDDVAGVEAADLAVGVKLIEVGYAKSQVGVGEQLDGLGSVVPSTSSGMPTVPSAFTRSSSAGSAPWASRRAKRSAAATASASSFGAPTTMRLGCRLS